MGKRKRMPASKGPLDRPTPPPEQLQAFPRPEQDSAMGALREVFQRTSFKADSPLPDGHMVECTLSLGTIRRIARIIKGS